MKRFLIVLALLCLCPSFVRAAEVPFISEVAWAASSISTADEWLEICATPGADISGWSIEGAATNLLTLPSGSVVPESGAFIVANYSNDDPKSTLAAVPNFVTTSVALSNTKLFLILRDQTGVIVDTVGASNSAPLAGTSSTIKASMERLFPLQNGGVSAAWKTADSATGFDTGATELGSPGTCGFQIISPLEIMSATATPDAAPASSVIEETPTIVTISAPQTPTSAVRLSEAYPIPNAGEREWIELVNPSSTGEVLNGWTIEDGKGTATTLTGTILPWGRFIISAPKGQLNNDGDLIVLKDAQDRIIDGVAYGAWDTALYPRVGAVAKGEAVMRLELQDTFDVTTLPTENAANVLAKKAAEKSVSAAISPQQKTIPEPLPAVLNGTKEPSPAKHTSALSRLVAEDTSTTRQAAPFLKTSAKSVAKKAVTSRYKGSTYAAVVAVPPGVYSKTRLYVLTAGTLREMRLSKSGGAPLTTGQRISFVAQTKVENGGEFLLTNPNSIRRLDRSASTTYAAITKWPDAAGAYAFAAEVMTVRNTGVEVRLGGFEGDILLPTAIASIKSGDRLAIEGFVSPGVRPNVVVAGMASVRLLASSPTELSSQGQPIKRVAWPIAALLTLVAVTAGIIAYMRSERLKRLALITQPLEEDFS